MSLNFFYSTPPIYTSKSLGYLALNYTLSTNLIGSRIGSFSNPTSLSTFLLDTGTYIVTCNFNYSNASTQADNFQLYLNSSTTQFITSSGGNIIAGYTAGTFFITLNINYIIQIPSSQSYTIYTYSQNNQTIIDNGQIFVVRIA